MLDLSGNALSNQMAIVLNDLLESAQSLKVLNLSSCLKYNEVTRKVLKGIMSNKSLTYLNLSNNKLNHPEFEYGSIIGRMLQVMEKLKHLDISCCKLSQPELLFIAISMKFSPAGSG